MRRYASILVGFLKVARWHGHENVKPTTMTYAPSHEVCARRYGKNRLARAYDRKAQK